MLRSQTVISFIIYSPHRESERRCRLRNITMHELQKRFNASGDYSQIKSIISM